MHKTTKILRTILAMAMIQGGFVLVSGWLHVAMAGGGRWTG